VRASRIISNIRGIPPDADTSPQLPDSFAARFRLARQQKNLTQVALAHTLRVSQSAVAQWESGRTLPSPAMRSRIENALNVNLSTPQDEDRPRNRGFLDRRSRLPILGSPVPGDEERILVDEEPRGQMFAPPQLEGVKGASAVYVRGRAMEPRYFAGEVVYLHPSRPPNPGDFIFVTVKEPGFAAAVGYVRQFIGADMVSIRVSTLNPKREELIPREAVVNMATIVGSGLF
jgi:transcriptional regulator with XRE-family HTH domain